MCAFFLSFFFRAQGVVDVLFSNFDRTPRAGPQSVERGVGGGSRKILRVGGGAKNFITTLSCVIYYNIHNNI